MKYDTLTRRYAKWLYRYIDRFDWAASLPDGSNYHRNCENWKLIDSPFPPQKLTQTTVEQHLNRTTKLHYLSSKQADNALIALDFDEHHEEGDSQDAAMYVQEHYLPDTFLERTPHGCRLFYLLAIGNCQRANVNDYLAALEHQLSIVVKDAGFKSPIEVLGGYTVTDRRIGNISRGQTASIPMIWNGMADMDRLEALQPIYAAEAFQSIYNDACSVVGDTGDTTAASTPYTSLDVYVAQGNRTGTFRTMNNTDAFDRMVKLCFDYTVVNKRMPDCSELLERYATLYGPSSSPDHEQRRIQRAEHAIKGRAKTFDESKAAESGYETAKPKLLEAIAKYATDKSHKYDRSISDEDLAIGLYLVQRNSFGIADTPKLQYTCPNNAFTKMFDTLRVDGLTSRCGKNRRKLVAIKTILERAKLIECVDAEWVHYGDGRAGLGKKYTIGRNHWRYADFVRFSEDVPVVYVKPSLNSSQDPEFVTLTDGLASP